MTTTEYRSHILDLLQRAKTLLCAGDYRGIIKLTSGSYLTDLWSAAMTAHYGPVGTHASWTDPVTGVPTTECLARFPRVGEAMREARENVVCLIGWYERNGGR